MRAARRPPSLQILGTVGVPAVLDWALHFLGLAAYTFLSWDLGKYAPLIERLPPKQRFIMRRTLEALKYGSGRDYEL